MMEFNPQYPRVLKTGLYGEDYVGKTRLVQCFLGKPYQSIQSYTNNTFFDLRQLTIDENLIKLHIWDTAGHIRYNPQMRPSYCKDAGAAIVAYDITNMETFVKVTVFTDIIKQHHGPIPILLVACKGDLFEERQVLYSTAREFATKHGFELIETSAKTGENVEQAFTLLLTMYLRYRQNIK